MQNIQARYSKLGFLLSVEKTEDQFIVKLPLINKNFKTLECHVEQKEIVEKQAKELKKYYKTLAFYILAVVICTGINLLTSWDRIFSDGGFNFSMFWAFWVILPWGMIILSKGILLFWMPDSKHD